MIPRMRDFEMTYSIDIYERLHKEMLDSTGYTLKGTMDGRSLSRVCGAGMMNRGIFQISYFFNKKRQGLVDPAFSLSITSDAFLILFPSAVFRQIIIPAEVAGKTFLPSKPQTSQTGVVYEIAVQFRIVLNVSTDMLVEQEAHTQSDNRCIAAQFFRFNHE
jgi:hypothetical protein